MNDEQMLRDARHLMLDEVGFEGQQQLTQSRVLILGLGGLGRTNMDGELTFQAKAIRPLNL